MPWQLTLWQWPSSKRRGQLELPRIEERAAQAHRLDRALRKSADGIAIAASQREQFGRVRKKQNVDDESGRFGNRRADGEIVDAPSMVALIGWIDWQG